MFKHYASEQVPWSILCDRAARKGSRKADEKWPSASEKAKKKGDHVLNAMSREVTSRETQLSRDFYGEVVAAAAKRHTRLFQLSEFLVHVLHCVNNSVISFILRFFSFLSFFSYVLSLNRSFLILTNAIYH